MGVAVAAGGFVLLGFATADTATADTGEGSRGLLPGATSGQHSPDSGRGDTSGEDGVLSENQTAVSVCVPVTVDGHQVTVIGDDNTNDGSEPEDTDGGDTDGGDTGGGDGGDGPGGDGDTGDGGDSGDGDLEVLPGQGLAPGPSGENLTSATAETSVPGAVDAGLGRTVTDRVTGSPLLPAGLVLLGLLCLGGAVRARAVRT